MANTLENNPQLTWILSFTKLQIRLLMFEGELSSLYQLLDKSLEESPMLAWRWLHSPPSQT